ncbi:MAG: hypothetical protein ACYC5H_13500 [Methylovirgula sp.]
MIAEADPIVRELEEKNKVIAHLTQKLALTRDCLEIARVALERIATCEMPVLGTGVHAECREIAREALRQI